MEERFFGSTIGLYYKSLQDTDEADDILEVRKNNSLFPYVF